MRGWVIDLELSEVKGLNEALSEVMLGWKVNIKVEMWDLTLDNISVQG